MSSSTDERAAQDLPFLVLPSDDLKLQTTDRARGPCFKQRDPTEKELCECIMMMKEIFPRTRLDRVIELLHDVLLREEERERLRKKKERDLSEFQLRSDEADEERNESYLSESSCNSFEKKKLRQDYALKFENSEASPRFYEQREIARLFCSKGYGYPTAREYLGDSITPNRYNNVITTIVRLSYRKLECFIVKHLQPKLQLISREELKMIKTPLVNCRTWMTDHQAENFHRFVKLTYKLKTREPDRHILLSLHEAIMQQLKKRNVTYRPHRRGGDPNAWSVQMDASLVQNYLLYHSNLPVLQQQLGAVYPSHKQCFQFGRLRLRLQRLLRLALRKVYGDRDKFGLNQPATLSQYLVAKISRAEGAVTVRKRLLSYLQDKDTNVSKLRWVREGLQDYVRASRAEVQQIEDSSCEVIPKEEPKKEGGWQEWQQHGQEKIEKAEQKENAQAQIELPKQSKKEEDLI